MAGVANRDVCLKCPASLLRLAYSNRVNVGYNTGDDHISFLGCAHDGCHAYSVIFWDGDAFLMRIEPGEACKLLGKVHNVWSSLRSPSMSEWGCYRSDRMDEILGMPKAKLLRAYLGEVEPLDFAMSIFCEEHAHEYAKKIKQEENRWRKHRSVYRKERQEGLLR